MDLSVTNNYHIIFNGTIKAMTGEDEFNGVFCSGKQNCQDNKTPLSYSVTGRD